MRALGLGILVVATMAAGTPRSAEAQRRPPPPRRVEPRDGTAKVYLGLLLLGGAPLGDFAEAVDNAVGGELTVVVPVAYDGKLRVRGELGGLRYGHEEQHLCSAPPVGCRIELDLTTDNAIGFGGIGAEFARVADISPYGSATIGFSDFTTFSTLDDDDATEQFHDAVFAGRVGGGVRLQLTHGRFPLLADVGVQLHLNGSPDYLVEGDIRDLPGGQIVFVPRHSDANLIVFQAGGAIGFGRHRRDVRRGRGR